MWWWTWVGCASTPEERLARGLAATDPAAAIADLGPACDAGGVAAWDAAGAAAATGSVRRDFAEAAFCGASAPFGPPHIPRCGASQAIFPVHGWR
ncbi:MAG: hypothetical protein ABMB14_37570, partial [Myxococcota bacterium]